MKILRLGFKKGQKGFTLVELMVVMGILGVLAAIVVPAVSGTTEVSTDAQVKTDAGMVQSAIGEYYGDQTGAEKLTTVTVNILKDGATARSATQPTTPVATDNIVSQVVSSRWPELTLTAATAYTAEFPYDIATSVKSVTIKDIDGNTTTVTLEQLAEKYNAIDFSKLYSTASGAAYIPQVPTSVDEKSGSYHNYLWLVKKTDAASGSGGTVESRTVVVFKLAKVAKDEAATGSVNLDTLTYEQIY